MPNEIAEPLDVVEIGRRLREARAARSLSLDTVSAACGISPSLLSQVERGKVTPSLATLHSITQVLNIAMFDLFGSPADRPALIRAGSRNVIRPPDSGGVSYELLSSGQLRNLQMIEMHLGGEARSFDHVLSHAGEECLIVTSGSARIKVGTEELTLHVGDSLSYVARLPHQFQGLEDGTRLIISMTPPAF
ncbi:helix-turn-helix domain-containing protein [Sphaerimonospora sp. CA-214678]|uniref:helix-turn-helix domain-containing protein n=1 Tax=Sphaerimonospora sp. CA-214678 TaxID=3240029 RepID=UPI003D8B79AA